MKTLLLIFISIFTNQALAQNITLHLGGSQNLPLKGQSNVWIQDRQLISAEVVGGEVRVRGLREGSTVIKIGAQSYQLQVVHPEKAAAFTELHEKMKSFVGLRVQLERSRLVVRGRLYRWTDWEKLADLLQESQIAYVMKAELSSELQAEAQRNLSNLLEKAKLPPQTIIFDPEPEIRVAGSDLVFRRYEQLFRPYGIQITKDETSLDVAPTIKVEITVAELKRKEGLQYGLKWPSSYTATIMPDRSVNKSELPFVLSALEEQGLGKVLASPNIICRSGKEAEFLAGGEFPIKVVNYKAQDVVWKRYGILLRVRPKADAAGRLSISVETEVSTLDKATSVEGIPGVLTNRVSSHFDLTKPQTIALSGLLKNENGNSSEGLPLLSRLPILGALFSSKDYLENRSELVIFVRPSIMKENEEPHSPSHLSNFKESI
ncbi:pilus assembly protein [Bdellovibrio sp. HCB2-146]|uniref:pilus assembly protein n=1 Tax=Bdellovibrio sp. HCB2-146 TaxID=3394362 RepID=UPI0039BD1877